MPLWGNEKVLNMIIRFGCSNFLSFDEYQEIIFTASTLKDREECIFSPKGFNDRVLSSMAIYGANASGKTNFLLAIQKLVRHIVDSSSKKKDSRIACNTYKLRDNNSDKESIFDIDFIVNEKHYHYGFSLYKGLVKSEWLYSYAYARRESRKILFHRDYEEYYFGRNLKGNNKSIEKMVGKNQLFISMAGIQGHEEIKHIYDFFENKFKFRFEMQLDQNSIAKHLEDKNKAKKIVDLMKPLSVGIERLEVKTRQPTEQEKHLADRLKELMLSMTNAESVENIGRFKEVKVFKKTENGKEVVFKLGHESRGTIALIELLAPAIEVIENGGVFVVDEIDCSLHPLLTNELIKIFNNKEQNMLGAQLLFSTHEVTILDTEDIRRDQIWIIEKENDGHSIVRPLTDFKLRNNAKLREGYLDGRFGGIPSLMNEWNEISEKNAIK